MKKNFSKLTRGIFGNISKAKYSVIPQHEHAMKKVTVQALQKKYKEKVPLTMVTAYDSYTASLVDKSGIDMLLVGDSLGMVVLGKTCTTSVTMDEMIHHCKAVSSHGNFALTIGDMPFGRYANIIKV